MWTYMAEAIMPFQFKPEHNQCEYESEAAGGNPPGRQPGSHVGWSGTLWVVFMWKRCSCGNQEELTEAVKILWREVLNREKPFLVTKSIHVSCSASIFYHLEIYSDCCRYLCCPFIGNFTQKQHSVPF